MTARPWTPAEDEVMRAGIATREAKDIAVELGRTTQSVFRRMQRLGIQKRRRWTSADDDRLRILWGTRSLNATARQLGRTPDTTYWRAQQLGLGLGCPQGFEYVSTAAERCGYDTGQLRRILHWAGVRISRSVARVRADRIHVQHTHYVDPQDVDDAVARWHATETVEAAARRLGMEPSGILRRLVVSGLEFPPRPEGIRPHWRIPSATIDEAMRLTERRGRYVVRVEEPATSLPQAA